LVVPIHSMAPTITSFFSSDESPTSQCEIENVNSDKQKPMVDGDLDLACPASAAQDHRRVEDEFNYLNRIRRVHRLGGKDRLL
jgi:hypothetical protein